MPYDTCNDRFRDEGLGPVKTSNAEMMACDGALVSQRFEQAVDDILCAFQDCVQDLVQGEIPAESVDDLQAVVDPSIVRSRAEVLVRTLIKQARLETA